MVRVVLLDRSTVFGVFLENKSFPEPGQSDHMSHMISVQNDYKSVLEEQKGDQ